jgi:hypothetical protein
MLLNLHKKNWTEGLKLKNWEEMKTSNEESIKVNLARLSLLDPSPDIVSRLHSACSTYHKLTLPR